MNIIFHINQIKNNAAHTTVTEREAVTFARMPEDMARAIREGLHDQGRGAEAATLHSFRALFRAGIWRPAR